MMRLKTSFLSVLLPLSLLSNEIASGEMGEYLLPMPQTTYANADARERLCRQFGEGYRLPSIKELFNTPQALIEKGEKSLYASSSESKEDKSSLYYFSFENRDVNVVPKVSSLYLVCFKEGRPDKNKQLIWGKTERNRMEHKEAKSFCEAKGERLPTVNELFSLALEKLENEEAFAKSHGTTHPKYYWSLDANDDFSNTALVVGFLRASVASNPKVNRSFVRCVKDAR